MNRVRRPLWISSLRPQMASAALAFTVVLAMAAVITQSARAQTFTLLQTFNYTNGAESYDNNFLQDAAGNLYGATVYGALGECFFGCGVVFRLDATGKETILYRFTGKKDGGMPHGLMVRDNAGKIYGTTIAGGASGGGCGGYGCGTVFKLDSKGKETVLYSFKGGKDGEGPFGGVVQDPAGNLYGTAANGGAFGGVCSGGGCGTVFKLDTSGKLTVLHTFKGGKDGEFPIAGLVRDGKGNLYGTTSGSGISGDGTVFRLTATGKFTVLHTFAGGQDGQYPGYGALLLDAAGNLYGTTVSGGGSAACDGGCGVVYKVDKTAQETVLYRFLGGTDGKSPYSALVPDPAGNLYSTTYAGGSGGLGTVFKLDPAGKETVLYHFSGGKNGATPYAGLFRDAKGNLYGTTYGAGGQGLGVIFKLTP
jgi:uncharacterized repeat protein (TIGR03803 family)